MSKYLYGASVQGIQEFIFQTNKLQEIVGASELVEEICTKEFWKVAGIDENDPNIILNAAGNIKYIFEDEEKCKDFVRQFPKTVMEMAPGITISQAVVKYEEGKLNESLQNLEDKLKEQRNKVSIPFEIGFMGTERARRTGGVGFKRRKKRNGEYELIDEATAIKINKQKGDSELFTKVSGIKDVKTQELLLETDDLKGSWLAVIHADGNGLGAILQNLYQSFKSINDDDVRLAFSEFSNALEESTTNAAQNAFKEVVKEKDNGVYPIRPIVLGGDDLTIIIRADLAVDFTNSFLTEFEKESQERFKFLKKYGVNEFEEGLTACAGIAFVKKSYPFHYAVDLAEKLCADAKNFVKGKTKAYKNNYPPMNGLVPKSAIAFFKVQDSFIESSLDAMKDRVANANGYNFNYGPYLLEKNPEFSNIHELKEKLNVVENYKNEKLDKEESKGISKLRQWITEIYNDKTTADFFLDRMKIVNSKFYEKMKIEEERNKSKSIIYDVIQLNDLKN